MQYLIVGILAGVVTALATVKVKALTVPAALEAFVIILCSCLFGGWFGLTFLLAAYFTIAVVDHFLKDRTKSIVSNINQKSGPRDVMQVAANGVPATISIVLYALTDHRAFLVGFAVALTEALADSIASDVGVLSKQEPVSICRFRRIPKGLSGGVSLLGTLSSFAATALCALMYYLFFREWEEALVVLLGGNFGCLVDSILGDLFQGKFKCPQCGRLTEKRKHCEVATIHHSGLIWLNNCMVNLVSNTLSAVAAVLLMW